MSDELEASLASDRGVLPEVWQRGDDARLPSHIASSAPTSGPASNTNRRLQQGLPHVEGKEYAHPSRRLVADLDLMASSLSRARGELIAQGAVARMRRAAETFGFQMATLDVREHASRHHEAIAELFGLVGVDYRAMSHDQRSKCCQPNSRAPAP